jgi:hypothetical protein
MRGMMPAGYEGQDKFIFPINNVCLYPETRSHRVSQHAFIAPHGAPRVKKLQFSMQSFPPRASLAIRLKAVGARRNVGSSVMQSESRMSRDHST